MLTLKRSNLSTFILLERESLTTLWDTLYLSPPQRLASFPPFAICVTPTLVWNAAHGVEEEVVNENVSEELLVAHEREREKWEGEVEGARGVLERLDKYFGVVEEMRELEVRFGLFRLTSSLSVARREWETAAASGRLTLDMIWIIGISIRSVPTVGKVNARRSGEVVTRGEGAETSGQG